jgi:hypothetical protein
MIKISLLIFYLELYDFLGVKSLKIVGGKAKIRNYSYMKLF